MDRHLVELVSDGRTLDVELIINHEPGSNEFSGSIQITEPGESNPLEYYLIEGTVTGNTFRFHDSGTEVITHYFWGSVDGDTINGQVSFFCYECADAYGTLTVNR